MCRDLSEQLIDQRRSWLADIALCQCAAVQEKQSHARRSSRDSISSRLNAFSLGLVPHSSWMRARKRSAPTGSPWIPQDAIKLFHAVSRTGWLSAARRSSSAPRDARASKSMEDGSHAQPGWPGAGAAPAGCSNVLPGVVMKSSRRVQETFAGNHTIRANPQEIWTGKAGTNGVSVAMAISNSLLCKRATDVVRVTETSAAN
jgi:hypothetical protein